MLCIDTSSVIAYLQGESGPDTEQVDRALQERIAVLAPVVVTELLSDPALSASTRALILAVPVLPLVDGYWERAGLLRAKALRAGSKAKLADALIAQSCLDHTAALVARDRDFAIYQRLASLRLLPR